MSFGKLRWSLPVLVVVGLGAWATQLTIAANAAPDARDVKSRCAHERPDSGADVVGESWPRGHERSEFGDTFQYVIDQKSRPAEVAGITPPGR